MRIINGMVVVMCLIVYTRVNLAKQSNLRSFDTNVVFNSVGNGDGIMINARDRSLILVDTGPMVQYVEMINETIPAFVRKLDYVIITHSHADHITGMLTILDEYEIGCVVYDISDDPISTIERTIRLKLKLKEIRIDYDNMCGILNENLQILKPIQIPKRLRQRNQNLESLGVIYEADGTRFYLLSDMEMKTQQQLLDDHYVVKQSSQKVILKVPHQGSLDALDKDVIYKLKPTYAIFSVGPNSYGHPNPIVIDFYESQGIRVLRTDVLGPIIF